MTLTLGQIRADDYLARATRHRKIGHRFAVAQSPRVALPILAVVVALPFFGFNGWPVAAFALINFALWLRLTWLCLNIAKTHLQLAESLELSARAAVLAGNRPDIRITIHDD